MDNARTLFSARHGDVVPDATTYPRMLDPTSPFTHKSARDAGWGRDEIERKVRSGEWTPLRHGVLVAATTLEGLDPVELHRIQVRAHLLRMGADLVASHMSAAALLGLPLLRRPDAVELTGADADSRRTRTLHIRRAPLPPEHVIRDRHGSPVTSPARTVVDIARTRPLRDAVVVADAALHLKLADVAALDDALEVAARWRGARQARRVVSLADRRTESPGESLLRLDLLGLDYSVEPQVEVKGVSGRWYRVDFLLEELGVIGEFDGAKKYDDEDGRDAVVAEKDREDDLRLLGLGCFRVRWRELGNAAWLRTKVERARAQSSVRARTLRQEGRFRSAGSRTSAPSSGS